MSVSKIIRGSRRKNTAVASRNPPTHGGKGIDVLILYGDSGSHDGNNAM
jgi:hypothetical protein